ncbi:hypothetical protein D3C87_1034130 [compost metagenome]|uniref:Uncharacterized protein n=1 Tax=Cupriavidus campinensis TaxID=151783 RepID=A0AAE9ICE1_9BURK|nr:MULTISPECIES: hypothetical protein [Cupriavidus]TSP09878.1 hypothetical protein FGG12_25460 [Cupriavidus campinensis]URF08001.1 hypothetical protein M5D45_22875 [Cupriavidus campinensis]CAG2128643.1 hypothetical protein LMG19282_00046 [Cupriavidus campinensis]
MSKRSRHPHDTPPRRADQTGASDPASIPSTLDPNLDTDAGDLERELELEMGQTERDLHVATEEDNPEDEISEEVQRAAESLPSDTPVDRADQTDKRMENPPNGSDL